MLIIVASVLAEGPHVDPTLKGDPSKRLTIIGPGIFQAIGVISFAFVCHHNSLLIYGSLRTPTLDRFTRVTHISTAISLVACCILAISAFWVFTDKTRGNILNNFSAVGIFPGMYLRCSTEHTERYPDQRRPILFRTKYVYHTPSGTVCLQRGKVSCEGSELG